MSKGRKTNMKPADIIIEHLKECCERDGGMFRCNTKDLLKELDVDIKWPSFQTSYCGGVNSKGAYKIRFRDGFSIVSITKVTDKSLYDETPCAEEDDSIDVYKNKDVNEQM